ncbi:MAG TPA: acyl-CoA dehydrogenase family protein, partial [Rhizomicrobium sp.]|nr:acyl-CoA dehydrogenase family protein [Rhizomicrobium sp.]
VARPHSRTHNAGPEEPQLPKFQFTPFEMPEAARALRREVRDFLRKEMPQTASATKARSWSGGDAAFSRKLGERGWLGMTLPKKYGGQERSYAERYVVIEEMLVAGAPVGLHWVADRQSGPLILRYGTEEQREKILPRIARGEAFFCIGMSEPGSGSDLASVRTRARKVDGGWRINGQKIWTSTAQHAHYMIALVRTGEGETRHAGLSQFIVDMRSDGLTVKPIANLTGESHFNEVFFDDVFVPDSMLIGNEGSGWQQVTAELAYERSGPERYLSSIRLFLEFLRITGENPTELEKQLIGRMTAEMWTLRNMSLSVMGKLQAGEDPAVDAAVVKDLGTSFEQELPRLVQANTRSDVTLENGDAFNDTLSYLLQSSPSFSLRGGTREILRGIIARELGLR